MSGLSFVGSKNFPNADNIRGFLVDVGIVSFSEYAADPKKKAGSVIMAVVRLMNEKQKEILNDFIDTWETYLASNARRYPLVQNL